MTQIYAIKETQFKYDIGRFKVKWYNKIHYANSNQKTEELAMLISKKITREWHYITIKKSHHHEDIVILNAYAFSLLSRMKAKYILNWIKM